MATSSSPADPPAPPVVSKVSSIGSHAVYALSDDHGVCAHVRGLYDFDLAEGHAHCKEFAAAAKDKQAISGCVDVDLHRTFYTDMKTKPEFLQKFREMQVALYRHFFPDQHWIVAQRMPNVRFHMPGCHSGEGPTAVSKDGLCLGRDTDEGRDKTAHPYGEHNFILAVTGAFESNALTIEDDIGSGKMVTLAMAAGQLCKYNGNMCRHGTSANATAATRCSLDFRCVSVRDFIRYTQDGAIRITRPNKERQPMTLGVGAQGCYYEVLQLKEYIFQMKPEFGIAEAEAAKAYVLSGGFLTEYRHTRELERQLAEVIGAKHCFMVSNGTVAITAALCALGIGVNDRVLVPSYTMVATANAVRLIGAEPIFVDVDPITLTVSPALVEPYLPTVKAVIHVSLNNRAKKLDLLAKMCKEANVFLIEDAAQSLGVTWRGRHLGTFGNVGTFSFSSPKIISMGQGGAIVTDDDALAEKIRRFKDFGRAKSGTEQYDDFGINLKYTDLQAVVGLEQLKKLPGRVTKMKRIWNDYWRNLSRPHAGGSRAAAKAKIQMIPAADPGWIPWFVEIFTDDRDQLAAKLRAVGIGVREVYPPIHLLNAYQQLFIDAPVAVRTRQRGLWLPSYSALSTELIDEICDVIKLFA